MSHVGPHSLIRLHYSIRLDSGELIETTERDQPMTIQLGEGQLPDAFETQLMGLSPGDSKTFELSPSEGYGEPTEAAIHWVVREEFPDEIVPEEGLVVEFRTPTGDALPGKVLSLGDQGVEVDFNHPYAGHHLTVAVELIDCDIGN